MTTYLNQRKTYSFIIFTFCSISIIGLTKSFSNSLVKEYSDFNLKGAFLFEIYSFYFYNNSNLVFRKINKRKYFK